MRLINRDSGKGATFGSFAGRAFCACALVAAMAPATALAVTADAADAGDIAAAQLAAQEDTATKVDYGGSVTASLESATQVKLTGIDGYKTKRAEGPAMVNPKATITCGETAFATNAAVSDGVVNINGTVLAGTYTAVISSDNYNDKAVTFTYPATSTVALGPATYEYLDASKALALVDDAAKTAALADYTKIGDTTVYYKAKGTALSGKLYGMDTSQATSYSALYNSLVSGGSFQAADYDTITSATGIVKNKHYGQLSSLVARTVGSEDASEPLKNSINGAYCTPAGIEAENATAYVEARVLKAAGATLTSEQSELAKIRLNGNASVDPSTVQDRVAVDTDTDAGFFTSCTYFDPANLSYTKAYGETKFVIRPKAGANGADFSWADYYASLYAGTISDGTTTIGMAPWIDLYAEAGHSAVEMSIANGTSAYNNTSKAAVNRFAKFYDARTGRLKPGSYAITLYAAGYNPLSYTFTLGAAIPSDDLKSVSIKNADVAAGTTATVESYVRAEDEKGNAASVKDTYASEVTVSEGTITLSKMLDAGDYRVELSDGTVYTFSVAEKGDQAIAASDVTKTFGDAAFALGAKLTKGDGKLTYATSDAKVATIDASGKVTIKGAGTANITVTAAETDNYKATTKTVKLTVNQAAQTIKPAKTYTVKAKAVKKKAKTFKVAFNANGGGKVSVVKAAKSGKVGIAKNGKVTVKKGAAKKTYTLKVKVKAAAKGNYKATTQTVKLKVQVK